MRKRDWAITISLVFLICGIDQITKLIALATVQGLQFWGPFGLVLHRNPGAMLGAFSNLPPILRVVSLSTGGAFLIFIYAAIQYLLPGRALMLRNGMSILLGGIMGNVLDRILSGSIVDFLIIGVPQFSSPAFNLADAFQWVGYFLIVTFLFKHGAELWPNQNERKKVWVKPRFQIKFISVLVAIGLGFAIVSGVYTFTYLKITIDELAIGPLRAIERRFIIPFLITFGIMTLAFIIVLFIIGKVMSHRMAGPLYAFELFLQDIIGGKNRPLRLRKGDEFQHLEALSEQIRLHYFAANSEPPPETPQPHESEVKVDPR